MKYIITILLLLGTEAVHAQTKPLSVLIQVGELKPEDLNYGVFRELKDEGKKVGGQKAGMWKEYFYEVTTDNARFHLYTEGEKRVLRGDTSLIMEVGVYEEGKRTGVWNRYKTFVPREIFSWKKIEEVEYQRGQKIAWQVFPWFPSPKMVELFSSPSPYDSLIFLNDTLQCKFQYQTDIYTSFCMYTPDRQKLAEYYFLGVDQVATGIRAGRWRTYHSNGNIESEETYEHGVLNGVYRYFHENGQLWTERIYKNGLDWRVVKSFDAYGNALDPGTLEKGNGTVRFYNESGQLYKERHYVEGKEIKK